jgi:hypothetical protein
VLRCVDHTSNVGYRQTCTSHYTHLFDDDHAETMAALGALAAPKPSYGGNVIPLRR